MRYTQVYLGCPMWANSRWKGSLFADNLSNNEFLAGYSQYFNSVEGNTSFYADPSASQLARWAAQLSEHFRFVFKVPRRFSHALNELDHNALLAWWQHFAPVHPFIGLIHLQLPASAGPPVLRQLISVLELLSNAVPLAVEVRHLAFFDKAEHELALNRLLQQYNAERVVLDSRALFSVAATSPALLDAQGKKPRLPVHAISLSSTPMLRFIGTDDLALNRQFYAPWLSKIRSWLSEGKTPYCFFHTPDNTLAPELCRQFAKDLQLPHPILEPWPGEQQAQLGLW
ncbi:hypothetical protein WG68_15525 [Arsukibacterium ikkense]|uniref:DUF72 domain-containing protein n=1 Tax=Arsukibacterium ikkense TaxID=336831 RepID=A0A0M2V5K7_9GAMM|nr:DUF72 domain-containing protein [Arsukibacterium ikkense]KKO44463.1 hypothetical protein WG68_15525 [Arsukibacterium ikkense]